jgi:3-hydroxybutyryl-CoA dehydrogenase
LSHTDISKAAVIGAGVMGHSIAQVFAQNGIETSMVDLDQTKLERAMVLIKSNLETLAEYGEIHKSDIVEILKRIHPTTDLRFACKDTQFVLEAINEFIEAKQKIYALLDEYCSADTILASNTSGLDVFSFVKINNPKRLIITHWFAPPYIIPLVEVVPGEQTSKETVDTTINLLKSMGKRTLLLKQFVPHFIINRIHSAIETAMWEMIENDWITPEEMDLAVKDVFGIRLPIIGIVQKIDFTGLNLYFDGAKDTGNHNARIEKLIEEGHLGVQTGRGIYDYGDRTEAEIIRDRDLKFLKLRDYLNKIDAFKPV